MDTRVAEDPFTVKWRQTQSIPFFRGVETKVRIWGEVRPDPPTIEELGLEEDFDPQPGRAQLQQPLPSPVHRASSFTASSNPRAVRPNSTPPSTSRVLTDGPPPSMVPHLNTFHGLVTETLTAVEEATRLRINSQPKPVTKRVRTGKKAVSKTARSRGGSDRRDPLSTIRNHSVKSAGLAKMRDLRDARGLWGRGDGGAVGADQGARSSTRTREAKLRAAPDIAAVVAEFNERQKLSSLRNARSSQSTPPGLAMPHPRVPPAPSPLRNSTLPPTPTSPVVPNKPPSHSRSAETEYLEEPSSSQERMPPPPLPQHVVKKNVKVLGMRPYKSGSSPLPLSQQFKCPLPRSAKTASAGRG